MNRMYIMADGFPDHYIPPMEECDGWRYVIVTKDDYDDYNSYRYNSTTDVLQRMRMIWWFDVYDDVIRRRIKEFLEKCTYEGKSCTH